MDAHRFVVACSSFFSSIKKNARRTAMKLGRLPAADRRKKSLDELLEERIHQSILDPETEPAAEVPPAEKPLRRSSTLPSSFPARHKRSVSPSVMTSQRASPTPRSLSPPLKESSLQTTIRESREDVATEEPEAIVPDEEDKGDRLRKATRIINDVNKASKILIKPVLAARAKADSEAALKAKIEAARSRSSIAISKGNWRAGELALNDAIALRASCVECMGEQGSAAYFAQLHAQRSFVCMKQKKLSLALADADASIALDPTSSRGFNLRGRALLAVERYGDAATAFEAGLLNSPTDLQSAQGLEHAMGLVRRQRPYARVAPPLEIISSHSLHPKDGLSMPSRAPRVRQRASEETICQMDAMFNALDENGDSTVTPAEITRQLRLRGYTDSAAADLRDVLDIDGDGLITLSELRTAFLTAGIRPTLEDLITEVSPPSKANVRFSELKAGVLRSGEKLPPACGATLKDHRMRGISLPHLRAACEHAKRRCAAESWMDFYGNGISPTSFNHYDLVSRVLAPATRVDQCSFAEFVASAPQRPGWMVVHGWGEPVVDFLASLDQHTVDRELEESRNFYYVCAYARNHHLPDKGSSSSTNSFFRHALDFADGVLCVVDSSASFVSRVWPLFEVSTALNAFENKGHARKLFDVYTSLAYDHGHAHAQRQEEQQLEPRFKAVGITDGIAAIDEFSRISKMRRELSFPRSVLWALLALVVETGGASAEDDRRFLLNTIVGRSNITLQPFKKHEAYNAFNADLRSRFAAYGLRAAVEAGGDILAACLSALQQTKTLRELHVCFAECDCDMKLTEEVLQHMVTSLPTSLVQLGLTDCAALTSAHWIGNLAENLESLSFEECAELLSISPEGLARLSKLKFLNLSGCVKLKELPDTIGMLGKSLEGVYLRDCTALTRLPSALGVLELLRELDLRRTPKLIALPNLSKLKHLDVAGEGDLFERWSAGGRTAFFIGGSYDPVQLMKQKRADAGTSRAGMQRASSKVGLMLARRGAIGPDGKAVVKSASMEPSVNASATAE